MRLEQHERVHVAGRLLFEGGMFVATDRLGSVVYKCGSGAAVQNGGFESGVASPWMSYGGAQNNLTGVPRTGSLSLRMTVTAGRVEDWRRCSVGPAYPLLPVSYGSASLAGP